jgi:hypothetical protein
MKKILIILAVVLTSTVYSQVHVVDTVIGSKTYKYYLTCLTNAKYLKINLTDSVFVNNKFYKVEQELQNVDVEEVIPSNLRNTIYERIKNDAHINFKQDSVVGNINYSDTIISASFDYVAWNTTIIKYKRIIIDGKVDDVIPFIYNKGFLEMPQYIELNEEMFILYNLIPIIKRNIK